MDYYRVIQADIRGHFEIILYKAYTPSIFHVNQLCNNHIVFINILLMKKITLYGYFPNKIL